MTPSSSSKFPRIPHLPWSPGATNDDKRLETAGQFLKDRVVITEKLDGSNVCLTRMNVFARSHGGPPRHPSFDLLKSYHATLRHLIAEDTELFFEWTYAVHSIKYPKMPAHLHLIGYRTEGMWASWNMLAALASSMKRQLHRLAVDIPLEVVPCLVVTQFDTSEDLLHVIDGQMDGPSVYGPEREGVVIRRASSIKDVDFGHLMAKCVRKDHVQTDEHWAHKPFEVQELKT